MEGKNKRKTERRVGSKITAAALGTLLLAPSCMTFHHKVHNGPLGTVQVTKEQYFFLFGLVPLREVDTAAMASPQKSYSIETGFTFTDLLVSALLSPLTIVRQTVTVKK